MVCVRNRKEAGMAGVCVCVRMCVYARVHLLEAVRRDVAEVEEVSKGRAIQKTEAKVGV